MSTTSEQKLQKKFGKRVASLRKQQGLTQQQLAEATNMSVVAIAYIETGKRFGRLSTLQKIAKQLKVNVAELFKDL